MHWLLQVQKTSHQFVDSWLCAQSNLDCWTTKQTLSFWALQDYSGSIFGPQQQWLGTSALDHDSMTACKPGASQSYDIVCECARSKKDSKLSLWKLELFKFNRKKKLFLSFVVKRPLPYLVKFKTRYWTFYFNSFFAFSKLSDFSFF